MIFVINICINPYLNEIGMFCISYGNNCMYFFYQLLFFIIVKIHIPFSKTSLTSTVLNKDETNLQ